MPKKLFKYMLPAVLLLLASGCGVVSSYKTSENYNFRFSNRINADPSVVYYVKGAQEGSGGGREFISTLVPKKIRTASRDTYTDSADEADLIVKSRITLCNDALNRYAKIDLNVIEAKTGDIVFSTNATKGDMLGGLDTRDFLEDVTRQAVASFLEVYRAQRAQPFIKDAVPSVAQVGQTLRINGAKFNSARSRPRVRIGGTDAYVLALDESFISVKVPDTGNIRNANVQVFTDLGESNTVTIKVTPSKPPKLNVAGLGFISKNGRQVLEPDSEAKVIFTVSNSSNAGSAFELSAQARASFGSDINIAAETLIGDILPGEAKKVEIPLSAGLNIPSGKAVISISFKESNNSNPEPVNIEIQTQKLEAPNIQIAGLAIDDTIYPDEPQKLSVGNGNGIIEPGESVEIKVTLINNGAGRCKGGIVKLSAGDRNVLLLTPTGVELGETIAGNG